MSKLSLSANLSFLFKDATLLQSLQLAARNNFRFVEAMNVFSETAGTIAAACRQKSLQFQLINAAPCEPAKQILGVGIFADKRQEFQQGVITAGEYAAELQCPIVHVMSGVMPQTAVGNDKSIAEYRSQLIDNLRWAVQQLSANDLTCVIEPISPAAVPCYFLNSFADAVDIIAEVPGLRLLLDVYHLQMIEHGLHNLHKYLPFAAHIQLAQAPSRSEPGVDGDIDFDELFKMLADVQFNGCIGLEYRPSDAANHQFSWFRDRGYLQ